jgi:hypothetical protein
VTDDRLGQGDRHERSADHATLLPELVAHLRTNRTALREQWAKRITDARLLSAMTAQEVFTEVTSVYDNYVAVLETGSVEDCAATPATCPSGSSRPNSAAATAPRRVLITAGRSRPTRPGFETRS